ncbi:uncharacterized protein [Rutidosis leptorrhynchoides]|uniref:uncharacterized protein n=1 Tax=Rutidosis leptorrhynchoides TaxID=125765 RepID=UPI003A98E0CB
MSEEDSSSQTQTSNHDLATQLSNLLKNSFQSQPTHSKLSVSLKINLVLNSQNYALWARMIKVAIGGKSKSLLNHLTTDSPENEDDQWEQDDLVIFSWLIQNIEPNLASNLTEFPIAKALWEALVVTYSSGKDKLQTFDLHVKANELKQENMLIEDLWIKLQGIWGEIERRDPNPMKCSADIQAYNQIRAEQKLFQFLNALYQNHDQIKRELLRLNPLPTVEEAYSTVCKEKAHQQILGNNTQPSKQDIGSGLVAAEGAVLIMKPHRNPQQSKPNYTSGNSRMDKNKLKCSKCGKTRHTREQCFEIVGFPEWWPGGLKKSGKAAAATVAEPPPTITEPELGFGGVAAHKTEQGKFLRAFSSLFTGYSSNKICHETNLGQRKPNRDVYLENRVYHEPCLGKGEEEHACNLGNNERNIPVRKDNHAYSIGKVNDPVNRSRKDTGNSNSRIKGSIKISGLNRKHGLYNTSGCKKEINTRIKGVPELRVGPERNRNRPNLFNKIKTQPKRPESVISCHNSYSILNRIKNDEMSQSEANIVSENFKTKSWILDCGATDTMTFDKNDIVFKTKPKKNKIQTANGEIIQVKSGGTIEISPTIKLPNCLYIPYLSHKLLSDIRTGLVIGRGTEKGGLYYIDEVSQQEKGIIHQTTCAHTPEQNGVAERKNRILLEMTRALIIESKVPKSFWPEALATATYLINRLPTKILGTKTPRNVLSQFFTLPSSLNLEPQIFGCSVFVHILKHERTKLDPCAEK